MDLGCLEEQFFNSTVGNSRKHHGMLWFSVNSPPLGAIFRLAVVVYHSVERFKVVIFAAMNKNCCYRYLRVVIR